MDDVAGPLRVVVMGVSGSGKTTVGERLAVELEAEFLDADDAHPSANVAKMSAGIPLTDEDREPWLARLQEALAGSERIVVTSSALKRSYRDVLRRAGSVQFVFLEIDAAEATRRVANRAGHFMGAGMIDSQFAALESPTPDETDVASVDASGEIAEVLAAATAVVV